MNSTLRILTIVLILLTLAGCAITHKFGPYLGKVIDAETGEPIEGAVVHIRFYTRSGTPAGANLNYEGSIECLTDKNGKFNLSYRGITFRPLNLWDKKVIIYIFKPGYGVFPWHKGGSITPEPEKRCCIEKNQFAVVRLPQLKTDMERRRNLRSIYLDDDIPYKKQKLLFDLVNKEEISIGLKPSWQPGSPYEVKRRWK
ncbi:MAG: carboxypeptidase-like regulatory domain-containing protein [Desulfobacteraceae bacterium]|nr:carboxypeptidase-like regulatory domain-containing protein [Desulfobacteraceae bacterium]